MCECGNTTQPSERFSLIKNFVLSKMIHFHFLSLLFSLFVAVFFSRPIPSLIAKLLMAVLFVHLIIKFNAELL